MDIEDLTAAVDGGVPIRLQDVPSSLYHAGPGISKSKLEVLLRYPPAVLKAQLDDPDDEESDALRFGKLVHTCILEPHLLETEHVLGPQKNGKALEKRSKADQATWKEFEEKHADKTIHKSQEKWDLARAIGDAVHEHPMGRILLDPSDGTVEESVWWVDPFTNVLCKCRPDKNSHAHSIIIDVKTAEDASEEGFAKATARHAYYLSDAMTRAGMEAMGTPVEDYVFFVVEKQPPYLMASYSLSPTDKSFGEDMLERMLQVYRDCLISDEWPGYSLDIKTVSMPRWAYKVRSFE